MQADYGSDNLVVLYWHLSDELTIPASTPRANLYEVSGIPHVAFDAVEEVIGGSSTIRNYYEPLYAGRLADPTPVTIESEGVINESGGWVTATFRAVDTVPYGDMTAYFIAIEETSEEYPYTVREVANTATVTLSAAGDSVVVTRNFSVGWEVVGDLDIVVFLEDPDPHKVVNAQVMPDPFMPVLTAPLYASEMDQLGVSVYDVTLTNSGVMADTITVSLNQDVLPAGVGPTDWIATYREVGGSWINTPSVFVLERDEELELEVRLMDILGTAKGMAVTSLTAVSGSDAEAVSTETFATFVGQRSLLVVDDDGGQAYESYLETALADTGLTALVWDVSTLGGPDGAHLSSYWSVLWTTANRDAGIIGASDEQAMMDYLDAGGNLMLASMGYLSSRAETSTFMSDYMHVSSWTADNGGYFMSGIASDDISDGMMLSMASGPFVTNYIDAVVPGAPAEVVFTSGVGDKGIKVDEDGHKLVFLAFPFENVASSATPPNDSATFVSRILEWFEDSTGVDDIEVARLFIGQNSPNPFNPVTRIAFALPQAADASLEVYNVNGRLVTTLLDGPTAAGPHTVTWDGTDAVGKKVASGVYFARLAAGNEVATRKMTLLK